MSAENGFDVFQAIVTCRTSFRSQPLCAKGECYFIYDNEEILFRDLQFLQPVRDGFSAQVHVGVGLDQMQLFALVLELSFVGQVEAFGQGIAGGETLTRQEEADEFLLMGMRLAEGIELARYAALAGRPLDPERLQMLTDEGLVAPVGNARIKATAAGMLVLDALVADLAR